MNNEQLLMRRDALILAGGKSSRMGQDKALLLFNDTPFLLHVDRVAQHCCNSVYIIAPWPDKYRDIVPRDRSFLLESPIGEGSLVAFYQGLQQIDTKNDWLLLLACDLPLLDPEIVLNWCNNLQHISPEILACVPKNGDRWEPLCGFYRPEILPHLKEYIDRGDRAFQTFLNTLPVSEISVSDREKQMLWNCNTPEDLNQINSKCKIQNSKRQDKI